MDRVDAICSLAKDPPAARGSSSARLDASHAKGCVRGQLTRSGPRRYICSSKERNSRTTQRAPVQCQYTVLARVRDSNRIGGESIPAPPRRGGHGYRGQAGPVLRRRWSRILAVREATHLPRRLGLGEGDLQRRIDREDLHELGVVRLEQGTASFPNARNLREREREHECGQTELTG